MKHSKAAAAIAAQLCTLGAMQAQADVDLSLFDGASTVVPAAIVDCTLTNGDVASCVELQVKYKPDDMTLAPTCPATIDDAGGIWDWDGENAGIYRVNRAFFEMLDGLGFHFFDDDGAVHISDPGAGRPDVDNACLIASPDDTVTMTARIPLTPQMADTPTDLSTVAKVGIALDGVPIFADAPSVLDTGHMPALDTCGGHVDPGGWYHWHATSTDIDVVYDHAHVDASCDTELQDSSALFGYAFDGYEIFGTTDPDGTVPTDLDACNGHVGVTGEYHYHATTEFPNLPPCLVGVQAEDNFSTTAASGIGSARNQARQGDERGTPPGFDKAAETLGISVDDLFAAVRNAGGRDADMAKVAATLGISIGTLQAALPSRP